jgi:iron complex outermembrane receptor protein
MDSAFYKRWLSATVLLIAVTPAHAQTPADSLTPAAPGSVRGVVIDAATGAPIPFVEVRIPAAQRVQLSTREGDFAFEGIPAGGYRIRVTRIGYAAWADSITVLAAAETRVEPRLTATVLMTDRVEVRGPRDGVELFAGQKPVQMEGKELREHLAATVGATMAGQPNVSQRSMGPAPARPVIRGLSGNRLLVLEDGATTGDLSGTSDDHAVVIDPIHAQGIDVIRGPAALLYGSTVLGGVVNVRRGALLDQLPARVRGTAALHGESANSGRAAQMRLDAPVGRLGITLDASGRQADDLRTPAGRLGNTGFDTWNGAASATYFGAWGHAGMAGSLYDSDYGIPGGFVGGHASGVDIALDRRHLDGRLEMGVGRGVLRQLELQTSWSRYFHEELEAGDLCGVSFGLLTYDFASRMRFDAGRFGRGAFGISTEYRDYANGCLSFIVPTLERTHSAFAYDQLAIGKLDLQGALRFDHRRVSPSRVTTNKAGLIRSRAFSGVSGVLAVNYPLREHLHLGATVGLSIRPPSLEELFSEGPHLAAYSYEIGNTELDPERGLGFELTTAWERGSITTQATLFHNEIDGFIQAFDTGQLEFGQGELGFLQRFQYRGQDARMSGAELAAHWHATPHLDFDGTVGYVRGTLVTTGVALPRIPPFEARLGAQYDPSPRWTFGMAVAGAAAQERLGDFEAPTAAWAKLDAMIEWNRGHRDHLHSIALRFDNLTDAEYRNHVSRIKALLPEPGRSVSLLYRVRFF